MSSDPSTPPPAFPPSCGCGHRPQLGLTLVELLLSLAIASILLAGLSSVVATALQAHDAVKEKTTLVENARFAMGRMERAVRGTTRLLIPMPENVATLWSESVRDVLAVLLDPTVDRDGDGFPDADNDRDGRIDEDLPTDATDDLEAGIAGIDDDGDGLVDEGLAGDDDEDTLPDEDPVDGSDDDLDLRVDEDPPQDMNNDGCPGLCGVDDDGDGSIDEGFPDDDDEDGNWNEDWLDPVVYFVNPSNQLVERLPNPGAAFGDEFTERVIAEGVTNFRVERIEGAREVLVDITLELTGTRSGEVVTLNTRLRVQGSP